MSTPLTDLIIRIELLRSNNGILNDVKLDSATNVNNGQKFITSHLNILNEMKRLKESGVRVTIEHVNVFYKRLEKFIAICEEKND